MSIHIETDAGYTAPRARRRPAAGYVGLELWAKPAWATVPTLEPIDAPATERGEKVPVAPIGRAVRDAVNRGRLTWSALAFSLGWTYGPGGGADTTRVLRQLGLALSSAGKGYPPHQAVWINRELAARIIRAAHLDPVDVGL